MFYDYFPWLTLLIYFSTMENIKEKQRDPHTEKVQLYIDEEIQAFSENSQLKKMREGTMSIDEFIFMIRVRLEGAKLFVPFLSVIQEKAEKTKGWEEIALALRENLNEELGIKNSQYEPSLDHDKWRNDFKIGLSHMPTKLRDEEGGYTLMYFVDRSYTSDTIDNIRCSYQKRMQRMLKRKNLPYLVGAFATLEGVLAHEFKAIQAFIRQRLTWLRSDHSLYIDHHAGHENRHMTEILNPLLNKCASSPHIVPYALKGIGKMRCLREFGLLQTIEEGYLDFQWQEYVRKTGLSREIIIDQHRQKKRSTNKSDEQTPLQS